MEEKRTQEAAAMGNKEAVEKYHAKLTEFKIRMSEKDGERVKKYAEKHGASVQGLILAALLDYMKTRKTPPTAEQSRKWGAGSFDELDEIEKLEEAREAINRKNSGWGY